MLVFIFIILLIFFRFIFHSYFHFSLFSSLPFGAQSFFNLRPVFSRDSSVFIFIFIFLNFRIKNAKAFLAKFHENFMKILKTEQ